MHEIGGDWPVAPDPSRKIERHSPFTIRNTRMRTNGNMKLKLARVEKGLSQQELADMAEVTRQTIGLIESGTYNPTLHLCIRIARALGKTLDQLFWEEKKDA
jgi:putative transcriptional regulator